MHYTCFGWHCDGTFVSEKIEVWWVFRNIERNAFKKCAYSKPVFLKWKSLYGIVWRSFAELPNLFNAKAEKHRTLFSYFLHKGFNLLLFYNVKKARSLTQILRCCNSSAIIARSKIKILSYYFICYANNNRRLQRTDNLSSVGNWTMHYKTRFD